MDFKGALLYSQHCVPEAACAHLAVYARHLHYSRGRRCRCPQATVWQEV